jgi:hypothetical protein
MPREELAEDIEAAGTERRGPCRHSDRRPPSRDSRPLARAAGVRRGDGSARVPPGIEFWVAEAAGELVGVMGTQCRRAPTGPARTARLGRWPTAAASASAASAPAASMAAASASAAAAAAATAATAATAFFLASAAALCAVASLLAAALFALARGVLWTASPYIYQRPELGARSGSTLTVRFCVARRDLGDPSRGPDVTLIRHAYTRSALATGEPVIKC